MAGRWSTLASQHTQVHPTASLYGFCLERSTVSDTCTARLSADHSRALPSCGLQRRKRLCGVLLLNHMSTPVLCVCVLLAAVQVLCQLLMTGANQYSIRL